MEFINQVKQSANSAISSGSESGGGGIGRTLLYVVVFALFIAVGHWTYTNYIAPMISANANQKQGSSKVDGDVDPSDSFDDAPIAELYLFKTDWCPHCKTAKPEWESLKSEYDGKSINGYTINFMEYYCTIFINSHHIF